MASPAAAKKKAAEVEVLRCLGCGEMLAYEVTAERVLSPDLHWMARRDGELRYFPCPHCHGRNIIEDVRDAKGAARHAVTRFAAAAD
jgi:hypothetical protein